MPHIALHFIHFDDVGGRTLDLSHFFAQGFDPLIDRHMTKPEDPTDRPKAQPFQVQRHSHAALGSGRGIRLVRNRIQILAGLTLVALVAIEDALLTRSALEHRGQFNIGPSS